VQANPRREDVNTEAEMLGNPALIRQAFVDLVKKGTIVLRPQTGFMAGLRAFTDWLELTTPKSVEDRVHEKWSQALTIYAVAGSNVLGLDCRTPEPEVGKALLERMVALYLEAHLRAYSTSSSEPFFRAEVERLEGVLSKAESDLSNHRLETNVFDGDIEKGLALTRKGEAEASCRNLTTKVAAARARVEDLRGSLAREPETVVTQAEHKVSALRDDLERKVAEAGRSVIEAESVYPPSSPFVERAQTTYAKMKSMLEAQPKERDEGRVLGPNPVRTTVAQELAKATAELSALEAELGAAGASVEYWDRRSLAIEKTRVEFSRRIVALGEAQKDLAQALTTARLSRVSKQLDDLLVANVAVIVPPTIVPTPIRTFGLPTRVAIVVQGALLGLVLGLGVALLVHARRSRTAAPAGPAVPRAWGEDEGIGGPGGRE